MNATIVSIMPIPFSREMTGHNPAWYELPEAKPGEIQTLVISESTSWLYVFDGKSVLRRHLPSDIASELLGTYISANMYVSDIAQPGIFWVEGKHDAESIRENFAERLEEAETKQKNWFKALVEKADDSWNRFHQHRDISTLQRVAAERLGLKREWNIVIQKGENYMPCPACDTTIKATVSVCPNCKLILKENPDFEFAR